MELPRPDPARSAADVGGLTRRLPAGPAVLLVAPPRRVRRCDHHARPGASGQVGWHHSLCVGAAFRTLASVRRAGVGGLPRRFLAHRRGRSRYRGTPFVLRAQPYPRMHRTAWYGLWPQARPRRAQRLALPRRRRRSTRLRPLHHDGAVPFVRRGGAHGGCRRAQVCLEGAVGRVRGHVRDGTVPAAR